MATIMIIYDNLCMVSAANMLWLHAVIQYASEQSRGTAYSTPSRQRVTKSGSQLATQGSRAQNMNPKVGPHLVHTLLNERDTCTTARGIHSPT